MIAIYEWTEHQTQQVSKEIEMSFFKDQEQ